MADVCLSIEPHFNVKELAEKWHLHPDTVRKLFRNRAGVIKLSRQTRRKRSYCTLSIPASIAAQVHEELAR